MSNLSPAALHKRLYGGPGFTRQYWSAEQIERIAAHYGCTVAPPAPASIARAPDVVMSAKSGSGRIYDFTISTGSVDRMGDTVAVDGWKLDQYKRNPVVLWAHDSASLPVGRAIAVFRDGERLRATMKFADTSFADRVRQQVDDGVVKATSVGFVPINFKFAHEKARGGGAIDFTEQELLEFSIVPIPANADALLNGPAKSLDAKRRARALELLNLQLPPPMSRAEAARAARAADLARIIARPAKDAAARRRELELAEIRSRDPSCTNWWLR